MFLTVLRSKQGYRINPRRAKILMLQTQDPHRCLEARLIAHMATLLQ